MLKPVVLCVVYLLFLLLLCASTLPALEVLVKLAEKDEDLYSALSPRLRGKAEDAVHQGYENIETVVRPRALWSCSCLA